jgi:hypothetical protein
MEGILREFSAPYHSQSMRVVERSNQSIQGVSNKIGLQDEELDLYLPLAKYSYSTMPRPMFQGVSSEVNHRVRPPEFVRFTRNPELPAHFVHTLENLTSMPKIVAQAPFHMIHTDFYKIQDLRWYQQVKAGTRLADHFPLGTWVFMEMLPKDKPPKMVPRFNGAFIVTKKLHRGAVVIRLQDGTETVGNLDFLRVLKGQPQVKWSKQLILTKKEGKDSSNSLVPAQVSQVDFSFNQDHQMRNPHWTQKFLGILLYLKTVNPDLEDLALLVRNTKFCSFFFCLYVLTARL